MKHDIEKARNLKLILSAFEQLLGLKINFHKSELFCFDETQENTALYAELFSCEQGQLMRLGPQGVPDLHRLTVEGRRIRRT